MTKNWDIFPKVQPYGEDLANFSCYRIYEKSAIAGNGVLSGCVVSRSSASAVAVASGTFTVAGVKKTFAGGSLTSISAAASGKHRYDLVYIDGADDTLKLAAGTEDTPTSATDFLENYVPRPAEPTDTDWIILAVIRVTESGIENTNFGTSQYATGSVANMRLGSGFGVDDTTLQVVDGVASVKASYVKADGTVPLTGNWDVGAYKVTANQLESDVAAGTAPLVVASDTVVSNLNASKLEGNAASAFAVADKGVTNGDSHDHSGGDGAAIVAAATSFSNTSRVLGRKTAGTGAGEECTASEVLDFLGSTRGQVPARGASAWSVVSVGEQGSIFYEGADLDPAWLAHGSYGDRLMSGGHGANPFMAGADGWIPAGETWTYASADDPTYTFTISGDLTAKYRPGMRVKLTQTNAKYFIITKVAYGSPNTTITVYGGTDYDLANAAITDPYYSAERFPAGFPASPAKWSVAVTDTGDRSASVNDHVWDDVGSITITIPIGLWYVTYVAYAGGSAITVELYSTLSTANNSESNSLFTDVGNPSGNSFRIPPTLLDLATKTIHYLNFRPESDGAETVEVWGSYITTRITAVCAYL